MAWFFGTSLGMSAFVVAFRIPNLFRSLFGEGALSSAFVPVFTESLQKEGRAGTWPFAARMVSALVLVLALAVTVGIAASYAALALWPLPERAAAILVLLRIMLPYALLICVAALFSAMLNSLGFFALPAAVPVAMNLVMICALALLCPMISPQARLGTMAWVVVAAGAVECLMQVPTLWREGFRPAWIPDFRDPRVRRVVRLMAISAVGMGATRVSVLVDSLMAVLVSESAASYLYFAERLVYLPLGVFATALGTVALPAFAGMAARNEPARMRIVLTHSARMLLLVLVPCAAGMAVLAEPIVRLLYERGDFTDLSTRMTALALRFYAPGLVAFGLLKVVTPAFYGMQDMTTPVRVGLLCTVLNAALNAVFILTPLKHAGIALATTLTSALNVLVLISLLKRRLGPSGWQEVATAGARMCVAAAVMSLAAVAAIRAVNPALVRLLGNGFATRALALAAAVAAGAIAYGLGCVTLRCPELADAAAAFRRSRSGQDMDLS